eukprot:12537748-Prorocentrum_lima.AAC.1
MQPAPESAQSLRDPQPGMQVRDLQIHRNPGPKMSAIHRDPKARSSTRANTQNRDPPTPKIRDLG